MKKLGKMNFERISRAEMKNIIAGNNTLIKLGASVGCGEICGHNGGAVCNEFGTCKTCGPQCTCI